MFMVELIYRVKTPLPLIVHHLMAVGYFILFAFALYDTSFSARSVMSTINSDPSTMSSNPRVMVLTKEFYLYARLATLQALHATCEPLDYLGM